MEPDGFSNELMMDLMVGRSLPVGVIDELHDQDWSMSYCDSRTEESFLQWESDCLFGTRTQNWLSGLVLFVTALLAYYQLFQCQCAKGNLLHWPCEGRILWALLTFLMWTLPMWNAIQPPFIWKYRDRICGLHQVYFGCFIATLSIQLANIPPDHLKINPNPLWFCTFPVLMESILARVRLKNYIFTNMVLVGVIVSPWFGGVLDHMKLSWEGWLMNCVIMFVGPGCILVLYERTIRKWYESSLGHKSTWHT